MVEKKRIKISKENMKRLQQIFNCKENYIYQVLAFHDENSEHEKKIRYVAMHEMNGTLLQWKE